MHNADTQVLESPVYLVRDHHPRRDHHMCMMHNPRRDSMHDRMYSRDSNRRTCDLVEM